MSKTPVVQQVSSDGYPVTRCPADDFPITDPDEGCALCASTAREEFQNDTPTRVLCEHCGELCFLTGTRSNDRAADVLDGHYAQFHVAEWIDGQA